MIHPEKFWMRFGYDWGDRVARNINVPEIGDRKDYSFNSSFQLTDQFRLQYRYRKKSTN